MRISALIVMALMGCAALAARAEDAPVPAEVPAATTTPPMNSSPPAPAAVPDSKSEKQLPVEAKSDKVKDSSASRYGFQRVDDGFLRFDYQTGQVAYCNARPDGWGCQPVPENRVALERELEQLRAEVADLKNQVRALTEPPRLVPPETVPPSNAPTPSPPNTDKSGDTTFSIPGREHITRAANAVQEAWQHFVDLVVGFTNDIRRKTGA